MIKKYTYHTTLVIACIILVIVSTLFIKRYQTIKAKGEFRSHFKEKEALNSKNIQGWMTFEYINRSFSIPNEYLKESLSIPSTHYPKITIAKASSLSGESVSEYTSKVRMSVELYLTKQESSQ